MPGLSSMCREREQVLLYVVFIYVTKLETGVGLVYFGVCSSQLPFYSLFIN